MDKKALYISSTIKELMVKSEMNIELNSVTKSCEALSKLFERFERALLDKDEELSFIYVMRFLTLLSQVKKEFRKDVLYINSRFNSKTTNVAFEKADKLKASLEERYKSIIPKIEEIIEPIKVEIPKVEIHKDNITVEDLYKMIRKKDNALIIDVRPSNEFSKSHINYDQVINIPSNELRLGCSIANVNTILESRNDLQELKIWKKRKSASLVVLVPWNNAEIESINLVKDAVCKWDAENSIQNLVVLEPGFQSFLTHYPTMVTNSKYKGPDENSKKDFIQPDKIHYPDWEAMETEKKRKKELKKQEEQKIIEDQIENEPENQYNKIKSTNYSLNRTLKQSINTNEVVPGTKSNLVIDRSLKPLKTQSINQDESLGLDETNKTNILIVPKENISLDSKKEKSLTTPDRSLKPNILREINIDPVPSIIDDPKNLESFNVSSDLNAPTEIPRLSNNSRTYHDRTNFTAKGGAKSIPPPTDGIESKKPDLPPWITHVFDHTTNEYYYIDKQNNKKWRYPPDEAIETSNEGSTQRDCVETLKDHSAINKSISKPISGSSLKRSTSQPNLSDDIISHKPPVSTDNTIITSTSKQYELPALNRQTKPSSTKTFTEFSASRLNNFNPNYRTVTPGLTGLRNMGNTCYMNSVVQALSNTKFLTNYILTNSYQHDINRDNPLGYGGEIVIEFAYLITALWTGTYREVSPSDFKRMIDGKNDMFRGSEQHDSQEFLLFLLDGLHEDLNRGSKHAKVTLPINEDTVTDIERANHSWKTHVAINDSVIVRIFQGQYRSKVTCDHCQMTSVTFDAFMYLSLPLVANHNRCSLEDCLKLFLAEERMTGASQWFCPKCKSNRNAKKKIDIWKLPPYLLIHLKRFSCTGQYRQKLNTFVDFPMESFSLVDILKHTKQPQKHDTYHLYAVSNHHGNMESGHYTSFCKNMKANEWHNYDDDVVTKIRESDVKTPSAYILFYESYNLKQAGFKS